MKINKPKKSIEELKKIIKKENISITELAQKLNISQPAASKLLNSDNISILKLIEICDAIGYDIEIDYIKKEEK